MEILKIELIGKKGILMWYEWLIFAIISLIIPFGAVGLKSIYKDKFELTAEQDRALNKTIGLGIIIYWLIDLFYMSFIVDSLMLKYIFGGIILIFTFYNLSTVFLRNNNPKLNFWLLQDFLVGIAMTIYLIYIIPNKDLQDIIIPIVSGVYGGLLTLVGVAWTIKKTESDRKAEEKKKAEPLFSFNLLLDEKLPETRIICSAYAGEAKDHVYPNYAHIVNSDNSNFYIRAIKYKGAWYEVSNANYVIKNHSVYFVFYTPQIGEDNFNMYVQMEDVLGFKHYYKFEYKIGKSKNKGPYTFMSSMKKVTDKEANG